MKEKLKAARIEIAFLVLTVAFLAVFFLADFGGKKDAFSGFSVEISGAAQECAVIDHIPSAEQELRISPAEIGQTQPRS